MSRENKKICIIGAGIGGLVAAHQLATNFIQTPIQIDIYESTNHIGGMARSGRDNSNGCPTEYSWRVYFWFYQNLFSILKQIPLKTSTTATVYDLLSNKGGSKFMRKKSSDDNYTFFSNDFITQLKFGLQMLNFSTTCDKDAKQLDNISWTKYKKQRQLTSSATEERWEPTPQVLGLDRYKASTYSVMKIGIEALIFAPFGSYNKVMTLPTSEAWFDHWYTYLRALGVRFHFGYHGVQLLQSSCVILRNNKKNNNTITSAAAADAVLFKKEEGGNVTPTIVHANQFILDLPVERLSDFIDNSPVLQSETQFQHHRMKLLSEKSKQLQLCFQAHFTEPIYLDDPKSNISGFILLNSPWSIIIETREVLFPTPICSKNVAIKGSWSILAGQDGVPGILFGKPFSLCTEREIQQELWAQILDNEDVVTAVNRYNRFLDLFTVQPLWSPIWPTFYYNHVGRLSTIEPKFSNNAGTLQLRPSCKLKTIDNVHLCTAFTREALDIFSMEGATISGMTAAENVRQALDEKNATQNDAYIGPFPPYPRPWYFRPFREFNCWIHEHMS